MSSYIEDENGLPIITYDNGKLYRGLFPLINLYVNKLDNIGSLVQRRIIDGYKYMITLCYIENDFINQDYLYIKTQQELMVLLSGYKKYEIERKLMNL